MKKLLVSLLTAVFLAGVSLAQNRPQANGGSESGGTGLRLEAGTIIRAELQKSVDAKKAKVGDEVIAKTMDNFLSDKNQELAPRGSRVLAHVTEVSPHQGESPSRLGIAFDKIVLKNGTEVALKASIQAIGWPGTNTGAVYEPGGGAGNSGAGATSPMPSTVGARNGANPPLAGGASPGNMNTAGASNPDPAGGNGQLTPRSEGVVGMSGVSLSTGAAQDSVLSSAKHNVKLDSGTQMILRVDR
jgi:hypothetical protein